MIDKVFFVVEIIEVMMSERDLKEMTKVKMYQTEIRQEIINEKVYIIDYNLYRELCDKLDQVVLKKSLYDNQKDLDY